MAIDLQCRLHRADPADPLDHRLIQPPHRLAADRVKVKTLRLPIFMQTGRKVETAVAAQAFAVSPDFRGAGREIIAIEVHAVRIFTRPRGQTAGVEQRVERPGMPG